MKHKDKEKPKDEKTNQNEGAIADFYKLLDSLLPQKSELLYNLREATENFKKRSEEAILTNKDAPDYALELEKEKTECLLELYKIALNQYLRISADYANYQKRVPKQITDAIAYEKEKIIKTLLSALDNFEHTFQKAGSAENVESLIAGIRIIYDQVLDILRSHGVEQIKALGEKFNPISHEAMLQKNEPDKQDNIILEEFQKGYKLNGHVIRPSRVVVNKLPTEVPAGQKIEETEEETTDTQ